MSIYLATDNIVFIDSRPPIKRGAVVLREDYASAETCKALRRIWLDDAILLSTVRGWSRRALYFPDDWCVEKFLSTDAAELVGIAGVQIQTVKRWKDDLKKYLETLYAEHC
jgi:hypothetical protein